MTSIDRRTFVLGSGGAGVALVAGPAFAAIEPRLATVLDRIANDSLSLSLIHI